MNNTQSLLPQLLPTVAALAGAALLALAVFSTLNSYRMAQKEDQSGETTLQSQVRSQPSAASINLGQIPNWHLFGKEDPEAKAKPVPNKIIEAPTTPLALTLQGTFLGKSKTEGSFAIISSSDDEQAMYQIGDEIPGGATLYAVEPFRVILERNGRHESLALPRPSMEGGSQASTTNQSHPLPGNNPSSSLPNTASQPAPRPTSRPASRPRPASRQTEKQALIDEMARIRKKFAK